MIFYLYQQNSGSGKIINCNQVFILQFQNCLNKDTFSINRTGQTIYLITVTNIKNRYDIYNYHVYLIVKIDIKCLFHYLIWCGAVNKYIFKINVAFKINNLYLFVRIENSQWLFSSCKKGIKYWYLIFLLYFVRYEDIEFHSVVDKKEFEEADHIIKFQPPDACYIEVMRFRTRPPRARELPMQARCTFIMDGNKIEIRDFIY